MRRGGRHLRIWGPASVKKSLNAEGGGQHLRICGGGGENSLNAEGGSAFKDLGPENP